ncbi:Protein DAMAGED DNA-BINDING 2 [Tetrabaena socialis]|uniref:Protein DAMAGED DNA-BINDING 2 n=1 Tax=Tetrabaena socialis TaxID=47790 RepID=A0A2J8A1H3_9CHLO|nr:Protein DAMAGED DNA-BINDING 2 [Tetrabaena socialis]|eukprot:PNH06348.1 Protein DAMAGED DNA-BINDING 2 [Tetrabaena socialis]
MAPRGRAPVVIAQADDDENSAAEKSSSSEEEEEEAEAAQAVEEEPEASEDSDAAEAARREEPAGAPSGSDRKQPGPSRLTLNLGGKNDECKVCGKRGHRAGFVGAVYLDCPNKPCYLCKLVGHTTATCPYRIAPGHGCTAAAAAGGTASQGPGRGLLGSILGRECCTLEFHPTHDSIVVSGDKKGGLAIWNFDQVHERTVYDTVHSCLANSVRFLPWMDDMTAVTTSSDGTAKLVDLETGSWRPMLDLNPGGWVEGGPWHMLYGCDASASLGVVVAGDSNGCVHLLDPRTRGPVGSLELHKKGNKVVSVHMHPLNPTLVLTAGNDHTARLFDIRELSSAISAADCRRPSSAPAGPGVASAAVAAAGGQAAPGRAAAGKGGGGSGKRAGAMDSPSAHAEIAVMAHPRVVNAAYFSPHTGRRILTTCQDNRLRVWDYAPYSCNRPADREIVHSHDFNRYLTPFKAEWDIKDPTESVFVVGRYISEDFGGTALHPIDVMSAATGSLLRQLTDSNLTTISPVNKPHPRRPLIVSGSSRSLYLWTPVDEEEEAGTEGGAAAASGSGSAAPGGARGGRAEGGGASGGGAAAGPTARASRTFVSYDADPGTKGAAGKKRKKGGKPDDDDD